MKIKKSFGKKIYIEWIDAFTDDGWKSYAEMCNVSDTPYCFTNAWFVHQTKDFLIVCHSKGRNIKESLMGKLVIPKAWIKVIR